MGVLTHASYESPCTRAWRKVDWAHLRGELWLAGLCMRTIGQTGFFLVSFQLGKCYAPLRITWTTHILWKINKLPNWKTFINLAVVLKSYVIMKKIVRNNLYNWLTTFGLKKREINSHFMFSWLIWFFVNNFFKTYSGVNPLCSCRLKKKKVPRTALGSRSKKIYNWKIFINLSIAYQFITSSHQKTCTEQFLSSTID